MAGAAEVTLRSKKEGRNCPTNTDNMPRQGAGTMTPAVKPSIGATYDPFGAHLEDPYAFHAKARVEEPVFYSPAFRAWVITRYEDVRHVVLHPEVFSSANAIRSVSATLTPECVAEMERGYPMTRGLLNTDGAAHERLRAPFLKALGKKRARRLEPFIRGRVEELVDAMAPAKKADLMHEFVRRLPFQVLAHLLGLDMPDYERVYELSRAASRIFRAGGLDPDEQIVATRRMVELHHLVVSYARARRTEPRDDLISAVVAEFAPGDAPLTFEQESDLAWCLPGVISSTNSVEAVLGAGMYYLLANHDQWATLVARPELLDNAVEEICRYDPPAQTFARITTRPVTIGGVDLPEGTEVMVMFGSANRDHQLVERPEEFDITRPRMQHLTFGQGSHLCLGAPVVRAVLRISLETFIRRMPGLRIADGRPVPFTPTLNHRQPVRLPVVW
jgi:cytochrome P450